MEEIKLLVNNYFFAGAWTKIFTRLQRQFGGYQFVA